ncbi:OPT oligopeptide transporter protein-domain-containing protein [Catenaria anguillulae PL171]|uniref:OPT oligopeptide transporter protein-domain-containing protein n=1 Tax=Catenaria anguillulae PL171 TaxID=765915 RepID=A0A1Y2HS14_9FUNG|nr:OPT oligopeptide transporter protein-domain-containing protein [Catenaria anguillulae PL171]
MTEKDLKDVKASTEGEVEQQKSFVIDEEFESMIADLVPTTDDMDTPSLTFRVWVLGLIFCCGVAFANQIFLFRTNQIVLSSFVTVLLSYPLGRIMAATLPSYKLNIFGYVLDTNPGPFSVKEHVLINVWGSTGSSGIYAFYNLGAQEIFYDLKLGAFWDLLFIFASSTMGFGLAGICRLYLIGPGYMSKMLQYIPLLCWIAPKSNTFLQQLGSPKWGPGVLSLTLDWTTFGSAAMAIPFWSAMNQFISWVLFAWLLGPLAWQQNWFGQGPWPKLVPYNSTGLFDGKGVRFSAAQVIRKTDRALDEEKFKARGVIHMTPFFASAYFGHMASLFAAITHTWIFYGADIMARVRNAKYDKDDIHCKLIDKYPEVPDSWYWVFFAITGVLITVVGQFGGIDLPIWATLLAVALAIVGTVPTIMIFATAGVTLGLNVVSQFTIGLICVCFAVSWQCRDLLIDLKIGHYMKIPPRDIFISQLVSQFIAGFQWVVDAGNAQGMGAEWGGLSFNTYYSASLIWGAIGAKRFFFETQYAPVIWVGVVAGITLPIVLKLGHKFVGGQMWILAHPAILLAPNGPGSNNGYALTSMIVSFFSQFYAYRYRQEWWKRYNYVLATAFDVGCAIVSLVIAFSGAEFLEWAPIAPPWNDWCAVAGEGVRDITKT